MPVPGGKDGAVEGAGEQEEEGQAIGHVAGIFLEEEHAGSAAANSAGQPTPALGLHEPCMQLVPILGRQPNILETCTPDHHDCH